MNSRILAAAARVLRRQGPHAFTTNRVAEAAGISIGSLYQYYPNKHALLFQLQVRESEHTWRAIETILAPSERPPRERLHEAIVYFFAAEAREAALRTAVRASGADRRDAAELAALDERVAQQVRRFLLDSGVDSPDLDFEAGFLVTLVRSVAEDVTTRDPSADAARRWSRALSATLCARLGI